MEQASLNWNWGLGTLSLVAWSRSVTVSTDLLSVRWEQLLPVSCCLSDRWEPNSVFWLVVKLQSCSYGFSFQWAFILVWKPNSHLFVRSSFQENLMQASTLSRFLERQFEVEIITIPMGVIQLFRFLYPSQYGIDAACLLCTHGSYIHPVWLFFY